MQQIYPVLLIVLTAVWVIFEIGLIVRDRMQGKGKKDKDRGTIYFNFLSMLVSLTAAGFIGAFTKLNFPGGKTAAGFWTGIGVMLAGMALRVWAVAALGESFRTTVETHAEQKVVRNGPYRLIRHPSYTALLLVCLGNGLTLQNWLSVIVAVSLPLAALLYRIRIEEAVLLESLGPEYEEYRKHTKKLIPWVW